VLLLALLACSGPDPEDPCSPGDVCRVIGTGDLGFNGEGLPALESWLYFPSSVRFAPDGRLVVVDFNNMRIRALDEDGTLETIAGSGDHAWSTPGTGVLTSALENPVDVVFLADGTFYIDALHEARILYVGADGVVAPVAGTGDEGYTGDGGPANVAWLSEAAGIAVGDDGTLYIADTNNNCIRYVGTDGIIETLVGAAEAGLVDGTGTDARFSGPQRLAFADGALWVADSNNHAIRRVGIADRAVTTVAGTGVSGYTGDGGVATAATLSYPYAVELGPDGALWIADSGNNVVRRVDPDGTITTVAGTGVEGLTGDDGPALDATFAFPAHLTFDRDDLIVADLKNGVVRRVKDALP
jgi:serine/threonine-protein kinase